MEWRIFSLLAAALAGVLADDSPSINSYDPEYGTFLGDLPNLADGDISGKVYVINDTALQVLNFTYNGNAPDLYFWLDREETPTTKGLKIPTYEFGITPLGAYENQERVVLLLPNQQKISHFKSFSLYCFRYEHNFSSLPIPSGLTIPKPQFLSAELKGSRYSVASGPILIQDRRSIKVFGFHFEGDKAPDGYFFVGRGPNVQHDAGVKVPIRGRDTQELISAMNERYRGGQDVVLTLPEEYDIDHIDWLAIYCYKFRVDFGHVAVSNISQLLPPYVPPQKRFDEIELKVEKWPENTLLGSDNRTTFTFQLGLPGGKKGYQALARQRPPKYVWYVNGYLADIYLRRGVTYTFLVEGGDDKSTADFYNPLYISDDSYGGYNKLSGDERDQVTVVAGADPSVTAGRLCVWSSDGSESRAETFNSFIDFRNTLMLKCEEGKEPAVITFTPDEKTPDTLNFNSYSTYNMGYKIHVVKELPSIPDWTEEPYDFESWKKTRSASQTAGSSSISSLVASLTVLLSFLLC